MKDGDPKIAETADASLQFDWKAVVGVTAPQADAFSLWSAGIAPTAPTPATSDLWPPVMAGDSQIQEAFDAVFPPAMMAKSAGALVRDLLDDVDLEAVIRRVLASTHGSTASISAAKAQILGIQVRQESRLRVLRKKTGAF
ncbi:MAG: hypothetical protein ACOYOB_18725 [Myxococcota bacterium]